MSSTNIKCTAISRDNKWILFFPLFMLFFPSVTFSIIDAEIFPWGILLFVFYRVRLDKLTVLFLLILFLSIIYGALLRREVTFEAVRSLFAYLNVILVSCFIIKCNNLTLSRLLIILKVVLSFYLIFGILQLTGLVSFLEPLVDVLMRRGSVTVTEGGRGVRLLASEPSRAALEVIFVYACLRVTNVFSTRYTLLFDAVIVIFLLVVIKSATGLLFAFVFFFLMYPKLSGLNLILFISALGTLSNIDLNSRAFNLIIDVFSNISFANFFELLIKHSGFRIPSVLSSYIYAMYTPLGGGVGQWMHSSIDAFSFLGIPASDILYFRSEFNSEFVAVRPTTFIASIALDLGILGVLFCLYWIFFNLIKVLPNSKNLPIYGMFIFYLLFFGEIGHPVPWVCMLYSIQYQIRNNGNST